MARDIYHQICKKAVAKNGWNVTHDPLRLTWGGRDMYIDLGAEQLIAAEKGQQLIAIEVKSFVGLSEITDLERAMGQYVIYRSVIKRLEPQRKLYLAMHKEAFLDVFDDPLGQILIQDYEIRLIIFDIETEEVIQWID